MQHAKSGIGEQNDLAHEQPELVKFLLKRLSDSESNSRYMIID